MTCTSNYIKTKLTLLFLILTLIIPIRNVFAQSGSTTTTNPDDFITTWTVTEDDKSITFPGSGSYTINWGDGTTYGTATTPITTATPHTYTSAGTYTVTASNGINRFKLGGSGTVETNQPKLASIEQWGTAQWIKMANTFRGATNMVYNATDAPNLSNATSVKLNII